MTQTFEDFLESKRMESDVNIIVNPDCVAVKDLGNWAWEHCAREIMHWELTEVGIKKFWANTSRPEDTLNRNRSAQVFLAKMALHCLGEAEIKKRLGELKGK